MSKPEGWGQLEQDHPEHIEAMLALGEAFGKHAAAAVRNKGKRIVFKVGRFDQAKNLKFVSQYRKFKKW